MTGGAAARGTAAVGLRTDTSGSAAEDAALWQDLVGATDESRFGAAWLALACRSIAGADAAILTFVRDGRLVVAAGRPADSPALSGLLATAQLAVTERRGVVQGSGGNAARGGTRLAYPILREDRPVAAVALDVAAGQALDPRQAMRQLQWSAAWIREFLYRVTLAGEQRATARLETALDLLAAVLEEERFEPACRTATTELATRLDCARVSLGLLKRGHCRVTSISHSAQFGKRMNLVRQLADSMDEAVDQRAVILFPDGDDGTFVLRAHAALAHGHGAGHVLTVPMFLKDHFVGAVTFERDRDRPFSQDDVDLAEAVVSILAAALVDKRENDRWLLARALAASGGLLRSALGPAHVGAKLAIAGLIAGVVLLDQLHGTYQVVADGKVEGVVQRSIVAPFDGYVSDAPARAGDVVRGGALLAALDDRDLSLERLRWVTERQQSLYQYDKALSERQRADTLRFRSQLEQAEAQIRLAEEGLARSRLVAPFDGLVLSGDLSQSIGAAVRRGDVLFEIAPLDDYRVEMLVHESQIAEVVPGMTGELVAAALPDIAFPVVVERITPVAKVKEGRTYFAVEARLTESSPRLRPGMDGVVRLTIGERRWVWIAFRSMLHWARVASWRWLP